MSAAALLGSMDNCQAWFYSFTIFSCTDMRVIRKYKSNTFANYDLRSENANQIVRANTYFCRKFPRKQNFWELSPNLLIVATVRQTALLGILENTLALKILENTFINVTRLQQIKIVTYINKLILCGFILRLGALKVFLNSTSCTSVWSHLSVSDDTPRRYTRTNLNGVSKC